MAQSKILLDTSSYLRLAASIHPLLFQPFGQEDHCLYCLAELDDELRRSPRLQSKFHWALQPEYCDNRSTRLVIGRKDRKAVDQAYDFIWDHVQTEQAGPSRVDTLALAHGFALQIPVVTDDEDMLAVAETYSIQTLRSLDLMKLMVDCGHIQVTKVREIVAYWQYWNDAPAALQDRYLALFGEKLP